MVKIREDRKMQTSIKYYKLLCVVCVLMGLSLSAGCMTFTSYAIPADRVPEALRGPSKGERVPLNLALLGQDQPRDYVIAPGDILGVYVKGLIPPTVDAPIPFVPPQASLNNVYYPPSGQNYTPAVGLPLEVNTAGELELPELGAVRLEGLTISQATELIARQTVKRKISQPGKEYAYLTLIRKRVVRILVIRDDIRSDGAIFLNKSSPLYAKHGVGQVIDLPAYENDVLHAITNGGGLPGFDAYNEIWVLRRDKIESSNMTQLWDPTQFPDGIPTNMIEESCVGIATKLPLWLPPCQSPEFNKEDVILNEGDVVFVRARTTEVFYTGGLLAGGPVPMPRDHDIDIIEAISLANMGVGGVGGQSGVTIVKSGAGPGNILPPSRALIIRKLPNNQQIAIRVDLNQAQRDRKHRIIVQPQDFISLHYTPGQIVGNSILNVFNVNYTIPN
jgi:hypothetical protein